MVVLGFVVVVEFEGVVCVLSVQKSLVAPSL